MAIFVKSIEHTEELQKNDKKVKSTKIYGCSSLYSYGCVRVRHKSYFTFNGSFSA